MSTWCSVPCLGVRATRGALVTTPSHVVGALTRVVRVPGRSMVTVGVDAVTGSHECRVVKCTGARDALLCDLCLD